MLYGLFKMMSLMQSVSDHIISTTSAVLLDRTKELNMRFRSIVNDGFSHASAALIGHPTRRLWLE